MKRLDLAPAAPGSSPDTSIDAERLFATRFCRLLDRSANALPQATLERLAIARKTALRAQAAPVARRAPVAALAFAGEAGSDGPGRFGFARTGLVLSMVILVGACLAGLYQFEQERRIEELADVDTAVLNDDLPISAYSDQGFNAFLKQNP